MTIVDAFFSYPRVTFALLPQESTEAAFQDHADRAAAPNKSIASSISCVSNPMRKKGHIRMTTEPSFLDRLSHLTESSQMDKIEQLAEAQVRARAVENLLAIADSWDGPPPGDRSMASRLREEASWIAKGGNFRDQALRAAVVEEIAAREAAAKK